MGRISILDCTLRDGGYINCWKFGKDTITGIVKLLTEANIEIVECGFLRDMPYDPDIAVFSDVAQIIPFISPKKEGTLYVGMIALGDISPDLITPYDGTSIDGIRLTFHKHEWNEARDVAITLMEKGYKVFVQPVGTTSYSDMELLKLVDDVSKLHPFAFYMVDTLGIMYRNDCLRMFYLIDKNLDPAIRIGFHSHNNYQLSFSNAQEIMLQDSKRSIIIDTSVYGMGRGAGNLPTELLTEYVNTSIEKKYSLVPLLTLADQYLMSIYAESPWGYALPYFLSAKKHCHPNYAAYLLNKETLDVESISRILNMLPADQSDLFHPELVEEYYNIFQSCQIDDTDVCAMLSEQVAGKEVVIIGSGASITAAKDEIYSYIVTNNTFTISVNFIPEGLPVNALFISNQKRVTAIRSSVETLPSVIASSNLLKELPDSVHFINYTDYLEEGDNAGAMVIRLMRKVGAGKIMLAGFDGFTTDTGMNYSVPSFKRMLNEYEANQKNADISKQLRLALGGISYGLLTPSKYQI